MGNHCTHTYIQAYMHIYTHIHKHTHTHTYTNTHTHTYTNTHTQRERERQKSQVKTRIHHCSTISLLFLGPFPYASQTPLLTQQLSVTAMSREKKSTRVKWQL